MDSVKQLLLLHSMLDISTCTNVLSFTMPYFQVARWQCHRPRMPYPSSCLPMAMGWTSTCQVLLGSPHSCVSLDSISLLLLLLSFLVCILAFLVWFMRKSQPNFLPPAPLSLPVLGHLHLLGKLPHQSLHQLSSVHGPLISLRLGSIPCIVASTPDMASEILQTHDLAFSSRPRTAAGVYCVSNCSNILFAPYGPYWRLMRQLCVTDLFSSKRVQAFRPVRDEEVTLLLRSVLVDAKEGRLVPVLLRIMSTTNNIISRMALGETFTELASRSKDPSENIVSLLHEVIYLAGVFNIGDFIPFLQWMDLQGYVRRMKTVGGKFKSIFQEIIDARRDLRKVDSASPQDFLDLLLSVSHDNQGDVSITDDNIRAVLMDMYGGGTDTSSITAEWALAELLRQPTIMKKVQAEVDDAVGKERLVTESDLPRLPYLQAIVKETMRLHPAVPLLLPHESTKPCQIAGYNIPAKTRACVNVWAIGRDPNAWDKPLEFWPERFLDSTIDVRGKHFQLLPFGAGRRGCPGLMLGLLTVQVMLANLVHSFEWRLPNAEDGSNIIELDMSEKYVTALVKAKPLVAMVAPRLPLHLYGTTSS